MKITPSSLWYLSTRLHQRGFRRTSRILKAINFLIFHAILPPEAKVSSDIELAHYGLGIVIHPNVVIGKRVKIYHGVTIAAESWVGSPYKVVLEDDVLIGASAVIIGRGDCSLRIGRGARIGANAVVTRDVPDGVTVVGIPARSLHP